MKRILAALTLAWTAFLGVAAADSTGGAKALFDQYIALGNAFDPTAADLYADDASIKNKRTYPDGRVRELSLPAAQYKALIRQSMPLAKTRGDTNSYSDISFTKEGSGVRIRATRFSNLKKYSSPISLLVSPDKEGTWLIREELSESQP